MTYLLFGLQHPEQAYGLLQLEDHFPRLSARLLRFPESALRGGFCTLGPLEGRAGESHVQALELLFSILALPY